MSAAYDLTPEQLAELVTEELLIEAAEARESRKGFFEFVLRDEVYNRPIRVADHQQLAMDFADAHQFCVLMFPFGHAKTYTCAGILLQDAGEDDLLRSAFVSAAQAQAEKPVGMIRQYIEESQELKLAYPKLLPSQRAGEPWTMTEITVARPLGIRDATVVARGLDSKQTLGSRWKKLIADDILNEENTRTPEQRDKVWNHIQKVEIPRLDPIGGRFVYTCTAWHPDDCTHRLLRPRNQGGRGMAGLVMRADGDIFIHNSPNWDSPLIRPGDDRLAGDPTAAYRLVSHDPDPHKEVPLWPERWPAPLLAEQKAELHPAIYNQIFLNICRDDTSSLCKQADIDNALAIGRKLELKRLHREIPPGFPYLIFIGVDLAFSKSDAADESAIFTFAVHPGQIRVPLWIESGRWGAVELYNRLVEHNDRYVPAGIAVESNAAQEGIRQVMAAADKTLVLKPHRTDATKNSIAMGVPSIFSEMANGCWAIPNDCGNVHPQIRKWIDQCLYYTPSEHTGDILMASYFARDLAKKYGALAKGSGGGPDQRIAGTIMSR
jgi:hypothetical protein